MARPRVNHVGHCVRDLARAQAFYTGVFGLEPLLELQPPDGAAPLLRLDPPMGMTAVYLGDGEGFVLELLHFAASATDAGRERVMDEPGLTHLSFTVDDLDAALAAVTAHGGEVLADTNVGVAVFVKDPDGQLVELLTGWQKPG